MPDMSRTKKEWNMSSIGHIDAYVGIYLLAYGIWLVAAILSVSFVGVRLGSIDGLMRYAGLAGALLAYLISGNWRRVDIGAVAILIVLLIAFANTAASSLIDLIVFVYCGRFIRFERLASLSACVSAIALVSVVGLAEFGFIENYATFSEFGRNREYLGFLYALQPAQVLFNISCLTCYLRREKLSVPLALLLLAANFFIYEKTDSRLSTGIAAFVVICTLLLRFSAGRRTIGNLFRLLAPLSFIACFIASWWLVIAYDPVDPFFSQLNILLEGRLVWAQQALDQYGTTLFGQQLSFVGSGLSMTGSIASSSAYNYVDMLFIRLPMVYGWIVTVIVLVAFTWLAHIASKRRDYWLALALTAIAMHCLVDDLSIQLQFNSFLFLFGAFIDSRSRRAVAGLRSTGQPQERGHLVSKVAS